jgi:metallophosphoesterase superfamily enzyme
MRPAQPACEACEIAPGVTAVAPGAAWLAHSRTLVAADAHLGYEDVVGGALPLWSTTEVLATLTLLARRFAAREIVFLGDVIHAAHMSEGAAREIARGLEALRAEASLVFIAGNHEGRTRGSVILGQTFEEIERDGWRLTHGDRPSHGGLRAIIGHLHPSLRLPGGATVPAFIGSPLLVVVPALTPYSSGLDVLSDDCKRALRAWNVVPRDAHVVAAHAERLYPFGSLARLSDALRATPAPGARGRYRRRALRPDK